MENTTTHNYTLVPGATILRHSGSASRPSPLRGSTSGRALTPTPRWRMSAPSRERRRNRSQPVQPRGLTRPRPFRDDLFAYAQRMHADHNHGHWLRAYRALLAIGAHEQVEALHAAAD